MSAVLTYDVDFEQKNLVDFYANEILKSSNRAFLPEIETLNSIKAALASHLSFNDASRIKIDSHENKLNFLLIEQSAFYTYAHSMMILNSGFNVSNVWNQNDALNIDYKKFDVVMICESYPAINASLLIKKIKSIKSEERPVFVLITEGFRYKGKITMAEKELFNLFHYILEKPIKYCDLVDMFLAFKLEKDSQNSDLCFF